MKRNPPWTLEEISLVAELGHNLGWPKSISRNSSEVIQLSRLLQSADIYPEFSDSQTFRNPSGVERKYSDLYTSSSSYTGKVTNGGRLTKEVMLRYESTPLEILTIAELFRKRILSK